MNLNKTETDAFSEVANGYDGSFTDLPSVALIRERVHALIRRYFPPTGTLLDIACGTGEDAAVLAEQGYCVIGTDRSYGMLAEAAAKSSQLDAGPNYVQMDAATLAMFRDSAFDAILSNFGGLNCVPDLRSTLLECHRVLRPKGTMVLCLLGAHSAWEIAAFGLRGSWSSAFRRRSGAPVQVRIGGQSVATRYYSVRSLRASVNGLFDILSIAALNAVAPPPASRSFMNEYPGLSRFLYSCDRMIQSFPVIRAMGDHTLLVLRRRGLA